MKNQYVGDIGDYGKYSLLRHLAIKGKKIGINWYLTKNDGSSDGMFTRYLDKKSEKALDTIVFCALEAIVKNNDRTQKSVKMIQDADLIPNAVFYNEIISENQTSPMERAWERCLWFDRSKKELQNAELIFADPDNGISYTKTSRTKGVDKYVLPEEVAQYYYAGKDVVFYCHKGRRKNDQWEEAKTQIKDYIYNPSLFVLTFHRGTQRSFIFVVHPERTDWYESFLTEFVSSTLWGQRKAFSPESIDNTAAHKATVDSDVCRKWAILHYFQKAFPTKQEKAEVLERMTNEKIDELIEASFMAQGKIFFSSFKKKEEV